MNQQIHKSSGFRKVLMTNVDFLCRASSNLLSKILSLQSEGVEVKLTLSVSSAALADLSEHEWTPCSSKALNIRLLLHFKQHPSLSALSSTSVPSLLRLQCVMNTDPLRLRQKSLFMSPLFAVDVTLPRMLFKLEDGGKKRKDGNIASIHKL